MNIIALGLTHQKVLLTSIIGEQFLALGRKQLLEMATPRIFGHDTFALGD